MHRLTAALFLAITVFVECSSAASDLPLAAILDRMKDHDEWQTQQLTEYKTLRTFYAANPRFRLDSTMLVETVFQKPETLQSTVIRHKGSELIRERVFDKILEAENDTHSTSTKKEVDITAANYNFNLIGKERCNERTCYRLGLSPKRKSKYSIIGEIWLDDEDFAIVRIHGSPAKRPSFWTLNTKVDRAYKRFDGIWLTEKLESTSDILIGGRSQLAIDYYYDSVERMKAEDAKPQ